MTRKVLGRGLGALIPQKSPEAAPRSAAASETGLLQLDAGRITASPHQPRKEFAPDKLQELVSSIASKGVIQPVVVRPLGDGRYELIAGERRWRAAREAGLAQIPAVVRQVESAEAMELALIENLQRENLNPMETAHAYQRLAETFDLSHEEIASRVGKDRTSVTNHLRLLNLPGEIQADLASGALSMGHARAILGIADRGAQMEARRLILARGLSVRETELLARRLSRPRKHPQSATHEKDLYINDLENSLRRSLGTKVLINHRGKRGVIELHYFSLEELDSLVNRLRQEKESP